MPTAPAKSKKPVRKVRFGGIAGLITAGTVTAVFAAAHIGVTKGVAALIAAGLVLLIQFGTNYFTKSGA